MSLDVGSRLAHYDVTALIGEGPLKEPGRRGVRLRRPESGRSTVCLDEKVCPHSSWPGRHGGPSAGIVDPAGGRTESESDDGQKLAVDHPQHDLGLAEQPNRELRLEDKSDGQKQYGEGRQVAVFRDQFLHRLVLLVRSVSGQAGPGLPAERPVCHSLAAQGWGARPLLVLSGPWDHGCRGTRGPLPG